MIPAARYPQAQETMLAQQIRALRRRRIAVPLIASSALALACSRAPEPKTELAVTVRSAAPTYVVHDTLVEAVFSAAGIASPVQQATLSTKLMASVTAVLVKEGDRVVAGQTLVQVDARDVSAKAAQVAASIAEAEATRRDAVTQANRIRVLYADSAATRAQLDAVETAVARADAGLSAAQASASELEAVRSYSVIRAPFAGIITKRFVDPGAFAAPGTPLVAIQDASTLRISASVTPDIAASLRRGQVVTATIENRSVAANIEGVVPGAGGNLYSVNALVTNPQSASLAGSAATLSLPTGSRTMLVVPIAAVVREGDLTSVGVRTSQGDERRWVRLGRQSGEMVEVVAGLSNGDRVVLPVRAQTAESES